MASGGDDRLVMVWGLSVAAIGTPGKHKAETWRCLATLRGHAGEYVCNELFFYYNAPNAVDFSLL